MRVSASPAPQEEKQASGTALRYRAAVERRRRADRVKLAVSAAVLAGVTWLVISSWPAGSAGKETEMRVQLGRFRPDLVERPAADVRAWADRLQTFKRRLQEVVENEKPVLSRWEAAGRTWSQVKAWRVKADGLVIDAGSGPDALSWAEVGAGGVEALVRACGLPRTPEDRLGLGIYYLCAGDGLRAQGMLDALRGTALEGEATRVRDRLGK